MVLTCYAKGQRPTMHRPAHALYLHVPFCRRRCGYCDFYKELYEPETARRVVAAMRRELAQAAAAGLTSRAIFVGGGTPTVLPPELLHGLLGDAGATSLATGPVEFTVEANPATVSDAVAAALVAAGVNRVSLGAQSFTPTELTVLDREHAPADVARTLDTCRRHGLTHFSLDLIFGVPGQTAASWRKSLARAVELGPEHLSCYGLTYEAGTALHQRKIDGDVTPMDHDLEADLYELTIAELTKAGFAHYEISNFARPGRECAHNLVYWHNEPYVGIGPAAAGYVDGVRYRNVADVAEYVAAIEAGRSPRAEEEQLPPDRQMGETMMLGLRLRAGVDRGAFARRFGRDPAEVFADIVATQQDAGTLELTPGAIRLSDRGLLIADTVLAEFL